ncbi:hypothetical protein BOW53_16685 [Solemya pervernicosa gill symbiont]|uniref:Cytochrome C n=3 Tax=Gammaproteobacteria incertae sedis TaxID=118884 RepID=A0A1T2KZ02_9GAMM|nr:hypothetical protein [Candidatus Reidiella endopervernicosa]OOZ38051.1 hypothetical protein BOW53_16685 [Solemya pervernicosa gill symbiont]QKQ25937.1 hypothetical protein HUE57_06305 [Candidatus Reidiella endopervernicosa]
MRSVCSVVVVLLLFVTGGLIYKFLVQGSVEEASDGRAAIQLTHSEKDLVLTEMRSFLQSVQAITVGLSSDDMDAVALNARTVGMAAQQGVPVSLMGKLPLEFKRLGVDTHKKFDLLALNAEQLGDSMATLKELSVLMQNCVACHEVYRLDAVLQE